jgi:hypothetical protein
MATYSSTTSDMVKHSKLAVLFSLHFFLNSIKINRLFFVVKQFQALLATTPRDNEAVTESAKQLLLGVKSMRELMTAMHAIPSIAAVGLPQRTVPAYRQLGVTISQLVQIGRDNESTFVLSLALLSPHANIFVD